MDVPLKKSRIRVETEEGTRKIIVYPSSSAVFFGGTFLALLTCLFFLQVYIRETFTTYRRYSIHPFDPLSNPWDSLIVILGVGVFLLIFAYVWESTPEIFHLKSSGMTYSTKRVVGASQDIVFTQKQLETLKLRERPGGRRLFIHDGNKQIELAPDVSGPEREWLYKQIKEKYSLGQVAALKV